MIRLTRIATWLFLVGLTLGAMLVSSFYLYLRPGLPAVDQLIDIRLQTPLRVYSSDNKLLAEFGEKRRAPIIIKQIPNLQLQAFLAAEDSRFYEHNGVDIKGLMRAAVELVTTGSIRSGGSTITMQVAKNYFLSRDRTFIRKFNEILLALQIEHELTKSQIFELYLNKIYLGNRAYGIEAASEVYYGKPVKDLDLAQMAMLAGLPKAPSAYNPLADPERALSRRNWILQRMQYLGMISSEDFKPATAAPITASFHGSETELDAAYLAEMARDKMVRRYGDDAYTEGYKVYLTIDSEKQGAANKALIDGLEAYDKRHGYRGPVATLDSDIMDEGNLDDALDAYNPVNELYPAVVTKTGKQSATVHVSNTGTATMPFDTMSWAQPYRNENRLGSKPKTPADVVSRGDIIYVRALDTSESKKTDNDANTKTGTGTETDSNTGKSTGAKPAQPLMVGLSQIPDVQGAVISLDTHTGGILALRGGYSFQQTKYNRAIQAHRQPGSNFKPFLYLAALEKGKTAATTINDAPIVFDDIDLETTWRPQNSGGSFEGPTRLREGLYRSRNLVSIRLLRAIGIDYTLDYIRQLKIDAAGMPHNLSLALGSGTLSPMQVARGFAVIANGGYDVHPYLIQSIRNSRNDLLYEAPSVIECEKDECDKLTENKPIPAVGFPAIRPAPRLADERAVYILHSILRDVITRGTGRRARAIDRQDIAGKTGTTNKQRDAWFSGFNSDVTATAWVGFDTPQPMGRGEYGARAALPVWLDYMKVALKGEPSAQMSRPNGIVTVKINAETGERAAPGEDNTTFEIFRKENVPAARSINNQIDAGDDDGQSLPQQIY